MPTGTIKRVFKDRGFGFIRTSDGQGSSSTAPACAAPVSSLSQRGTQWNLKWNPALRDPSCEYPSCRQTVIISRRPGEAGRSSIRSAPRRRVMLERATAADHLISDY